MFFYRFLFIVLIIISIPSLGEGQADTINLAEGKKLFQASEDLLYSNLDSFYLLKKQALVYFTKANSQENILNCYNGFSSYYYYKRDHPAFARQTKEAIDFAVKNLPDSNKAYGFALNNYGLSLKLKGDFLKAIQYYKKGLAIEKKNQLDPSTLAYSYINISGCYRFLDDFDESIIQLNHALSLQKNDSLTKPNDIGQTYLGLGHSLRDKGDYDQALGSYFNFLKIIKKAPNHPTRTANLIYGHQSIARIYLNQNQNNKALEKINQLNQLQRDNNAPRKIQSFELIGDYHLKLGNYLEAIIAFTNASNLAFEKYSGYKNQPIKARTLRQLAIAYSLNRNTEKALVNFQKALQILSSSFKEDSKFLNPDTESIIHKNEALEIIKGKAQAFTLRYQQNKDQKDLQAAFDNYQYATTLIQQLRQSFLAQGSKEFLAQKALPIYEGGIETALMLQQLTKDDKYLDKAVAFAEQNKAMLLLESLQEANAKFSGAIPKKDLEQEQQLRIDIAFYEKQINNQKQKKEKADSTKLSNWQNQLFDLRQDYQKLIAHFEKDYPQYYELKYSSNLASASSLRKKIIDNQTALLEYFIGKEKSYLFCITKEKLKILPLAINASLPEDISALRQLISVPPQPEAFLEDCQNFSSLGWKLHQQLIAPALEILPKSIQHLLIVPDDILALIPFELLLSKQGPEKPTDFYESTFDYLQNDFAISYNYSASLLQNYFDTKKTSASKSFLGFAPSFGETMVGNSRNCTGDQLLSLQCNQKEVQGINELFNGQTILSTAANRQTFIDEVADYQIVHLATHACAGEEEMSQNKIHFADDFLSNKDLHNLNLNADLVVLSACNTGSGKLVKGEGIMSLSRGFILAGCPSTLMSLWAVDDCSTSNLMQDFYKKIKQGLRKDKALQQAKLQHLKSADKAASHPYYWAAFVQSGNADQMNFSKGFFSGYWKWVVLGFGLLFFLFRFKSN